MRSKFYKNCAVPQCPSTTNTTPEKLFIHVPRTKKCRKKWFQLARRDTAFINPLSKIYFCEDHFNLPTDMENYIEYHVMGSVSQIRMKPDCLPTKFGCQTDRKRRTENEPRPLAVRRQRLDIIAECVRETEQASTQSISKAKVQAGPSSVPDPLAGSDEWACRRDVCRCCLAAAGTRDMDGAHVSRDGQTEDYLHMLQDCYGITLSNLSEQGSSRFICGDCVNSLRAAHKFKQKVLQAESKFISYHSGTTIEVKIEEDSDNTDEFESHENEIYIDANTSRNETEQNKLEECKVKIEHDTTEVDQSADQKSDFFVEVETIPKTTLKRPSPKPKNTRKRKPNNKRRREDSVEKESDSYMAEICYVYRDKLDIIGSSTNDSDENATDDKNLAVNRPGDTQVRNLIYSGERNDTNSGVSNLGDTGSGGGNYVDPSSDGKPTRHCNDDSDSDTPIAQLCKDAHDIAFKDKLTRVKGTSDVALSRSVKVAKAPVNIKSCEKQVSQRKRIRLTCDTVLKHTTACPFRHHKSWFQCFYCTLDFMEINELRQHTAQTHTPEELSKLKRYPYSLQIDITDFQCKICCVNLSDVNYMVKHFDEEHGKVVYRECIADYKVNASPYTCHICSKQYHVFRTLTTHLNEHYANCICDVCGKSFLNSKRLKVHKQTHESGHFPCTECGKVLKTKTSKANHMETHLKRVIKCNLCLKPMKHYNERIKHMSEQHNITHKFKCLICGKEFNIKHYLATHMRQTHRHKNKKCMECGMVFITNHGLKKHMLKHSGVKAFACMVCSKTYARSYTLKEHMRGHDSEKFSAQ